LSPPAQSLGRTEAGTLELKRELSYFDLTNIVVGAIVGSDIYVASAITAGLIGPLSIIAWIVAGAMASVVALVLAYFSYHVPRVGGTFAFISAAFDDFYGFLGGWSMWIAEVVSLPVFAITFANYLGYFVQLDTVSRLVVQGLFLFGLTAVNVLGVRAAGKVNDVLTLAKLAPLLLLIVVGLGTFAVNPALLSNYSPFAPFGWGNFGGALVLIFWAYAGFEMGTLPASEVTNPEKTIPKAIVTGMLIVTAFYLLTNFVIFGGVGAPRLATTTVPLVLVGTALLGTFGATTMTVGALISVSGSDESGTSPTRCPSTGCSRPPLPASTRSTRRPTWPC
jgi:amino acid transporter